MSKKATQTFQGFDTQVAEAYREWPVFLVMQMRRLESVTAEGIPDFRQTQSMQPVTDEADGDLFAGHPPDLDALLDDAFSD